ncbi:MAG TPA: glycosyl hydrolase, partial [Bacteroidales bacterium]|nr:glycosyl hydrolase [Bacteroidales bacterium]
DIATELKKFQAAGIPVLWRPLHEAGGGWFWWGAKGPEPCKALYNILYNRLKNYHHLHNLLWVWSTPEADWYPGNDKVDIMGYDSYPGNFNYGPQKYFFDELYKITGGKKLIAMTENGPVPDPLLCFSSDAPWSFFVSWSDLVTQQNSQEHLDDVFSQPLVFTLESEDLPMYYEWRSSLYPEDWKPGYKDKQGRFLHDFSYAGYHRGEKEIPGITKNIVDVTRPPYNADNTGTEDVTDIIQQALDNVGSSGGGVVYLPAGTYRIATPDSRDYGLRIKYDSTVLRGAGTDSTFIFHDQTYLRLKNIIEVYGEYAGWHHEYGAKTNITVDLNDPTRLIPVTSVAGFKAGDLVVVKSTPTEAFMEEHGMGGIWTEDAIRGVHFLRRIDSIDTNNNLLFIDAPTRYYLKTRDNARVYHAKKHITECGIENLSVGNRENPKEGWDEETYTIEGTGAYDVHFSHVLVFKNGLNCWVKNVHTYKPTVNTQDIHILSNGLALDQCRFMTIDSCDFQKSQYEGGGGNGYMYILESNDCLVENSRGNDGRHNFDFKFPYSNGNVILHCRTEHSKYASDFHMYLSMANLFDGCTVNEDYLESTFRPYGGDAIHGYSSTQSVFYNTTGLAFHEGRDFIVDSRQFGWGYVIGTSGTADRVKLDPVSGTQNGYSFDTSPKDFLEGEGLGESLTPTSLYLDQLDRRLNGLSDPGMYQVRIIARDEDSNEVIPESEVNIYNESRYTDNQGEVIFPSVYENFIITIEKGLYQPLPQKQVRISSDTVLTYYLKKKRFDVTFRVVDTATSKPLPGTRISLGGVNEVADANGNATLTVPAGENEYSIDKISFSSEKGTLDIISDTTFTFYLVRTAAIVKFYIKEGEAPVNEAVVMVGEDSIITGGLGLAKFSGLPVDHDYHFRVSSEDYDTVEGNFYLRTDTSIYIALERIPAESIHTEPAVDFSIWPNPAHDELYVRLNTLKPGASIRIVDIRGNVLYLCELNDNPMRLDLKRFPQGMFFLQLMEKGFIRGVHIFVRHSL